MIPLYKPFTPDLADLNEVLHSGALAYGKYGKKFEEELSRYFRTNQLITTSSFNMAILVALSTLNIVAGDEVIISPMACLASTQPLASIGIKIIWADIDPNTGTLSPRSVIEKISPKTKAIIHNHYCGYIGYIDEINEIGKKNGIPIIDDGIEGFGSEYKGNKLGNCGTDITIFSFGAVRIPNTIDGGLIIFKDKELFEKSKLVRDLGINRKKFRNELREINSLHDIDLIGYNAMMSEVNSYIGVQQMKHVNRLINKQRENAIEWNIKFVRNEGIIPITRENTLPNYWVYGILTDTKVDTILSFREKGFYASSVHINNNIYSVFGDNSELKGVNDFYNRFVALPCGWWMGNK